MFGEIIKGLRIVDTRETCFEAWKSSHMGCFALVCGRFADSRKSCFQASKLSNMGSAVLDGGRSADIHEFCLTLQNFQIWTVSGMAFSCGGTLR